MVGGIDAMLNPILAREWLERVIIISLSRGEDAVLDQILVRRCGINQEWLYLYIERVMIITSSTRGEDAMLNHILVSRCGINQEW